jgi:hypothetical protein
MGVPDLRRLPSPLLVQSPAASPQWRVRLALLAWWRASELDRQLATGASPATDTLLAVRACNITTRRSRGRIADGLLGALRSAGAKRPTFTAAVPPHREEVRASRELLQVIADRVRAPAPVAASGMAMLHALLSEPDSPLYRPECQGALTSHLHTAAAALEPADGQSGCPVIERTPVVDFPRSEDTLPIRTGSPRSTR